MNQQNPDTEVRFDAKPLQAQTAAGRLEEDPWGAFDDDEYAVPGEVTGGEKEANRDEERRKRRSGGMALRGSGTRGKKGKGTGAMPGGMMPPNASVGGVGGAGAPGAGGPVGMPGGAVPQPMAGGGAGMGMPGGRMAAPVGGAAAPGAGGPGGMAVPGGGPMAAGTEDILDAEQLRQALERSGLDQLVVVDSDGQIIPDPLVDTDGDGIPDTRASQVTARNSANANQAPTTGVHAAGLQSASQQGPGTSPQPGTQPGVPAPPAPTRPVAPVAPLPAPSQPAYPQPPGYQPPGYQPPGYQPPGYQPPGYQPPGYQPPTYPQPGPIAAGGDDPAVDDPADNWDNDGGSNSSSDSGVQAPRPGDSSYYQQPPTYSSDPSTSSGTRSTSTTSFAQSTPSYTSSGGTDYQVAGQDLRNSSQRWQDVAEQSGPLRDTVLSTPDAVTMFGVLKQPVVPYVEAVQSTAKVAEEAGLESTAEAVKTDLARKNYQDAEDAALQEIGRANQ